MAAAPLARKVRPNRVTDTEGLTRALMAIADRESVFTERFYELLFERRPDTRELFGAYPIAEQEEMMRETLRSLATLEEYAATIDPRAEQPADPVDGGGWLAENLRALGESHAEYGVTPDMYECYRGVLIECARETAGALLDEQAVAALTEAIAVVCDLMVPQPVPA